MTGFPVRSVPFLRDLLGGRAALWPGLADSETERLVNALDAHGAMPIAHEALRCGRAESVPLSFGSRLRDAHLATGAQNAVWLRERDRVVDALRGAGIEPLVLKGTALMDTVYDSIALRPVADIDLLVGADEVPPSMAALEKLGYEHASTDAEAYQHHAVMHGHGSGGMPVAVELHRRLFASPPYDRVLPTADLVHRAERAGAVLTLAPVDCLLHLSGHLVLQHARCERLVWVADIDRLVRACGADNAFWDELLARAPECLLVRSLSDALGLGRLWFDTPVPPGVLAHLAELAPTEQEAAAYRRLRRRAPVGQEGARLLADVRGVPGLRAKLRFTAGHLFPPPDAMRAWYGFDHVWQLPVYYARRAVRGVAHIARRTLRSDTRVALDPPDSWMIEHDA
jgi:hypothetical protein